MPDVRKGQAPPPLDRDAFRERFEQSFFDPAFAAERDAISRLEGIAWEAYRDGRKAPVTHPAGPGFADPDYKLSDEWRAARDWLLEAQARQRDAASRSRVLVFVGAARNDGSCPGEISITVGLAKFALESLEESGLETDLLDLSLLTRNTSPDASTASSCTVTSPAPRRFGAPCPIGWTGWD